MSYQNSYEADWNRYQKHLEYCLRINYLKHNPEHKGKIERFIKTKQKDWGQEAIGFEFEDDFFMFPEFSAEMEWFGNAQANIKKYVKEHLSGFASFNTEQVQEMAEDYYQWLNEMGREFDVERNKYFTCTTSYQHEVKQCYYNSLRYSWEDPDAQYYEGWVVSSRLGLPIRHAWIVSDGEVFDPTFEVLRKEMGYDDNMDYAYWGVEIPSVFISERIVATGLSGPYLFCLLYTSPSPRDRG